MSILLLILAVIFIVVSTTKFNLHPFLALLFAAIFYGLLVGMPFTDVIASIQEGFGGTLGNIGILIIAGTIIGVFLEKSGGAFALAEKVLNAIGDKHVPTAMSIIGYIIAIPVFSDSGFVILTPLNRALTKKAGLSLAGTAVALGLGLSVAHAIVPPTPGPIAAAGILGADLGMVIGLAIPVSLFALVFGWLWATKIASKTYIDPNPELSDQEVETRTRQAPSAAKSVLPILLPLVLIVLRSIAELPSLPFGSGFFVNIILFIGHPIIALLIGVLIAFTLPKKFESKMLSSTGWVGKGLLDAAIIIMITGAGGAFGKVLQNSGIATLIGDSLGDANLGIWLPFILAAGIKSAQGSSTVALITTASIVAPLMSTLGLDTDMAKALVVLVIGAGSLVVSHANDSFFWVFTQMTDMEVKDGYKLHTTGTLILGATAAFAVWVLSLWLI
ncbi:GntP family permease [Porifericola rhodea]|uniref:GntP family permease n=1 Tax=Porifericola rhodea TaxID=930972 RepID=UPI00266684E3|nr:GntP family permease [Porifericola rhodea]WKN31187.1 GntP family permease [Porifericola rhodea]